MSQTSCVGWSPVQYQPEAPKRRSAEAPKRRSAEAPKRRSAVSASGAPQLSSPSRLAPSRRSRSFAGFAAALFAVPALLLFIAAPAAAQSVPSAPTNLTATEGHHAVRLDWDPPDDDGGSPITGYYVTFGGTSSTPADGTTLTLTRSLIVDGDYNFQVVAVNGNDDLGALSAPVAATLGPATLTIAGDGEVAEGADAVFTLTASKPVLSTAVVSLSVSVEVSESANMVTAANEGTKTVDFAVGKTTATLRVPTLNDGQVDSNSVVTAAIQADTDYTVGMSSSATVTVVQGAVPGAPTGLTHTDGHQVVKLHWTAPVNDGGSPITKYKIRFNTAFYETENTSYVVTGQTGQIDALWHLEVRAVNANGEGPAAAVRVWVHSATVTIAGGSDVLEGQEAEFTLTADRPVLSTARPLNVSVLVSEDHPGQQPGQQPLVEAQHLGDKTVSFALNATTAAHSVPTLQNFLASGDSDLTAAIQTSTDYTDGNPSSATVKITERDHVPDPPTDLVVTHTHFDVDLSWTAPAFRGSHDSPIWYEIDLDGLGDPLRYIQGTSKKRLFGRTNIAHRDASIRVRAANPFGDGEWSDPVLVTLRGAAITIAGNGPVPEGSDAVFTLTTDLINRHKSNGINTLAVNVLVSETDDMVATTAEKVYTVRFATDATTATLTVPTEGDDRDERDSVVTATIQPSTETALVETYETGSPASATVTVANDDVGNFERRRLDSCGVSAPHSSGHGIECFQLVNSSYVRTPEGMAERGYAPIGIKQPEVGDIVAMEGLPDDWVINVLGAKVDAAMVTIAAGTSPVTEGANVMFTVTRATVAATHLSVTVTLSPGNGACGEPGVICTAHGRKLSNYAAWVAPGPSPNTVPTGLPAITGTARVGDTLTASVTEIADADGLSGATFAYQWVSSDGSADTDIAGATAASYTLTAADAGKAIKVRVTFTDDGGTGESLVSAATGTVAAANAAPTGLPAITGTARVGETLEASVSGIADADGLSGATFSYQWVANEGETDVDIAGATAASYTLSAAEAGKTVKVRMTFTDGRGTEESLVSEATAAVNTPATGLPAIAGTARVGETLEASVSEIADADGLGNAAFAYQWVSNDGETDADIAGATAASYTLTAADAGSGAIRITPGSSGRGLMLSIAPQWGRTARATERLWSAHDASALGADNELEADARLAIDASYGVGLAHGRGVLTPYAGLTLGDTGARTVRTGTRWQLGPDTVVGIEATRQASDAGEADNQLMLRAALRF